VPAFRTTRLKHVIEATGLQKRFGAVTALAGLDLFVEKGTILALLGPNGAGKTTAVSILTTLLRADAGTARIAGADVRNSPEQVRRLIGLSGQHTAVDGYLTGSDRGLAYPQRYRGGRSWVCAAILFSYALSWVMALVGLMVPSPEVINNASFMVVFPLTFVVNTFVPTENLPKVLRVFAEWNPVSAVTQAARESFGNIPTGAPDPSVWSLQNPVIYTIMWVVVLIAIFAPLSVARYRSLKSGTMQR